MLPIQFQVIQPGLNINGQDFEVLDQLQPPGIFGYRYWDIKFSAVHFRGNLPD